MIKIKNDKPYLKSGKNIRSLRIGLNLDQPTFANLLGCAKSTVSNWETGRKRPGTRNSQDIVQLAVGRGITITLEYLHPR